MNLSDRLYWWQYHRLDSWVGYLFWPAFIAEILSLVLGAVGL